MSDLYLEFQALKLSIKQESKSRASTSRTPRTRKPPKLKEFLWELRGKITKKRGTPTLCVIPNTNPTKKLLQNLPTKIHQKGCENHRKQKRDPQANHKRAQG
jgi:hypothetical protein